MDLLYLDRDGLRLVFTHVLAYTLGVVTVAVAIAFAL